MTLTWNDQFLALFDRCCAEFQRGNAAFETYYQAEDLQFLDRIGYQTREFFDFVEDFCGESQPSISTALLVAAVRRDYFLTIQKGQRSEKVLSPNEIPSFGDELGGISYLPRIIAKARAKLRGELDPDLMFGCGGDRNFLRKNGDIHPADFLRQVWAADGDDAKLLAWLESQFT